MNLVEFPFTAEELHGSLYIDERGDKGHLDVYKNDNQGRLAVCAYMIREPYSRMAASNVFEFDAIEASKLKFENGRYSLGE